ncbi:hypothetical protein GCM10027589_10130 [Actinocorallia lasiicapitis]
MFKIVVLVKLTAGAAFAGTALLLDRIAADRVRAHLLWTCNPLMLWACVAGAHLDVYGAFFMVAGFAALKLVPGPRWAAGLAAGALIGVAGGVKAPFVLAGLGLAWACRRELATLFALLGGVLATGLGSYLLAGPQSFDSLLAKSADVAATNPWRYFPEWGIALTNTDQATWGYLTAGLPAAVLLWRLAPGGDAGQSAARVGFVLGAALLITSPVQHPWYDPLFFPLLALMAPTAIDGLMQLRLAIGSLGYLPGVALDGPVPYAPVLISLRYSFNNWWVSAGLGIIAIIILLVPLLPPHRQKVRT